MEKQLEHTPTPWHGRSSLFAIGARNDQLIAIMSQMSIGQGTWEANLAFILRACNNHDFLVSEIKQLLEAIDDEGEHEHDGEECDVCYAADDAKWQLEKLDKQGETGPQDLLLVAVELIEIANEDAGLRAASENISPALRAVYESYLGMYEKWLDKAKGKP